MDLTVCEGNGQRFVEGAPGQQLMRSVDDVATVLEASFAFIVRRKSFEQS